MKFLLKLLMLISRNTLRLMIIQIIGMNLVLAATSHSQDLDKVKVSLKTTDASLAAVLKQIEEKTEFVFAYTDHVVSINKKFNLRYSRTSLRKILADLANEANVEFKRINNTISVTPHTRLIPVKAPDKRIAVSVSGRVTDEAGTGLPGVNVVEKGTANGTTTNTTGDFTIEVAGENSVIVFSFIGYQTQEVIVGNQTSINVGLLPDVTQMQEVVVIGYQTIEKKDVTGAVSVVDPADANKLTATSLAESIQGLAPGVTVRNGGAPGQMARIEIRGVASFRNSDPLYVIDGMIADANTTINTNDIASIDILKDASAAAIYGSRAANGVIIVTTKQGKEGPPRISFSAKYGVQKIPKQYDLMNASEFAAMQRTQYENSSAPIPPSVAEGTFDPSIDTDWQEEVIRSGTLQDYNLNLSGGTTHASYLISGSYFTNKGVLIGNEFKRGSFRVNSKIERGRFTFGENLLLTNTNNEAPGEGNPFYDMPQMLPVIPVRDESYATPTNPEGWGIGTNDAVTYAWNSVAVSNLVKTRNNYAKLIGNAFADVKIFDWLKYRFNTGAEVSYDFWKRLRKVGVWQYNAAIYPSSIDEERSRFLNLLFEHTLSFNKKFGMHNVNGVFGISRQHFTRESTSGGRANLQQYGDDYLETVGSGTGASYSGGGIPIDYKSFGYLGRINYSFRDTYLVTLTGRVDEDSRFGSNYRTGFFPSAALGWRISNEDFFNVGWVSDLKLHMSYGTLGITNLGSYEYTAVINFSPRAVFGPGQNAYVGSAQARLANADLKWEERVVKNIGFDLSVLENKFSISVEAYNSLAKDNLLELPLAGYLGNLQGDPPVNAGSIRNTGVELSATYRRSQGDFKWDVSANLTTIRNKIIDVGNRGEGVNYIPTGNTRTQVGRSLGEWYVLETDGIFQSDDEVQNYTNADGKVIQPFAKAGDIKFVDHDGNGEINNEDRVFRGSPWPKIQSGIQFNAGYGPFTLNVQMIGVFGNTIYNDTRRILDSYQRTNFRSDVNPWTPQNTNTDDPRIGLDTDPGISFNNVGNSDRWLESGSYVRMRNVELAYSLPTGTASRYKLQSARVFISAQNLFTITKYSGLDPDVVGNGIFERGLDSGNWPASRVYSIGLSLGL
jgi:TonB-dependent starch-binding outer membrane protein SusC